MTASGLDTASYRPQPIFDHLERLSDSRGLFEHAQYAIPRREHGYCVDDVARGLVVVCREPMPPSNVLGLGRRYLDFVLSALDSNGACHNRMGTDGQWHDAATVGDWWGRAVWGLGVAATRAETPAMRASALNGFRVAAQRRSPHLRSMTFAALGAAEILSQRPAEAAAESLLRDGLAALGEPSEDLGWPWPEARLSYANAAIAEVFIIAGAVLPNPQALSHGLQLLEFLLKRQTRDGHLSVTPVGGCAREDTEPGYDQQPIEVAALADACASAYRITLESRWLAGTRLAWSWFLGNNDSGIAMFNPNTGGGYDGLELGGRNLNQGAESTLAMLSTAQHARRLSGAP